MRMKIQIKQSRPYTFFMAQKLSLKIFIITGLFLVLADAAIIVFHFTSVKYSSSLFQVEGEETGDSLLALNSQAVHSRLSKPGYIFYKFTNAQKKRLMTFYNENDAVSISAVVMVKTFSNRQLAAILNENQAFYMGFLCKNDFNEKGKLSKRLGERILSGTDLRVFAASNDEEKYVYFENALALEKNLAPEHIPEGVMIYSSLPIRVHVIRAIKAKIGFDISNAIPFYGVCPNGGVFGSLKDVDFSGASMVFPVRNSSYAVMPKIEMRFSNDSDNGAETEQPASQKLNMGGEILTLHRAKGDYSLVMQTENLSFPFSRVEIPNNDVSIVRCIMSANDLNCIPQNGTKVVFPLLSDPGLVIKSQKSLWRVSDYELYAWDRFPNILFFDTKDYTVQADFFRRLAFFVEKAGFKGRILSDAELGNMHGYNAHDYSSEKLAEFFTALEKSTVQMNDKEKILREILLKNKILFRNGNGYSPGNGAVVSISQESAPYLRHSLSAHEVWHGLFFTDEDFRNYSAAIYYTIDSQAVDFIKGYWTSQKTLGYDTSDEVLMHNEFMAYIMQQPISAVSAYFLRFASFASVNKAIPNLCNYVKRTEGRAFEDAAKIFDSYVFDRWGLNCGRVSLIIR